jgi:hypothetical protein
VVNISEGLAARLKPLGIRVTVLCPSFVRTRINESRRNRSERYGPARIPDPASPAGVLRTLIAELTRSGLDPSDVAAQETGFTVLGVARNALFEGSDFVHLDAQVRLDDGRAGFLVLGSWHTGSPQAKAKAASERKCRRRRDRD